MSEKQVAIYSDGACRGNPGPGGYGTVLLYGSHRRELSGGYRLTTNNRMELLGAIRGLEALKEPCSVELFTDSEYLVNAMTRRWVYRWREKGWRKSDKQPALNRDLWERMLELCEKHSVAFTWVKGHAGDEENERCDELAVAAAQCEDLAADEGYE